MLLEKFKKLIQMQDSLLLVGTNYLTEEKLGILLIQKSFNLKNPLSIIKA